MSIGAGIKIEILTNKSEGFYLFMGPWLANRQVIAELGNVPFDDENKTWIVAIGKTGVVGFVGAVEKKNHVEYCSDFVEPQYRRVGIYRELFTMRNSLFFGQRIKAMVTDQSLPVYVRHGFCVVKKYRRYTALCRCPGANEQAFSRNGGRHEKNIL